ncbi:hypothetical protein PM082_002280 [Marasmius tenuissimus]|nr:hypothetical protein PM082_002280 [Marasmius tenuissimus]
MLPNIIAQLRSLDPIALLNKPDLIRSLRGGSLALAELDRKIRALECQLLDLKSERDGLKLCTSQLSSLLSPIRRLPSEILHEIFSFATGGLREGGNKFGFYSSWESRTMRISAVCHRWRCIVLDYLDLWTHFAVGLETRARDPVERFLILSKDRPIYIMVTPPLSADGEDIMPIDSGLLRILRYSLLHILDKEVAELPHLQSVVCVANDVGEPIVLERQLKGCTSLETVAVGSNVSDVVTINTLPLPHIASVIFRSCEDRSIGTSFEILRTSDLPDQVDSITYECAPPFNELSNFYFAHHTPLSIHGIEDQAEGAVVCKKVSKLEIDLLSSDEIYPHISDILQYLTLPSLEQLCLAGRCKFSRETFEGAWPGGILKEFLARSRCPLTELSLKGLPLSAMEVMSVLRDTPALERLEIHEVFSQYHNAPTSDKECRNYPQTVTKGLLEGMRLGMSDAPGSYPTRAFLPRLGSLAFRVHGHFDADVEFVEAIQSRWCYVREERDFRPLRIVTLHIIGRDADKSLYQPIKACDKEGRRVVLPHILVCGSIESHKSSVA